MATTKSILRLTESEAVVKVAGTGAADRHQGNSSPPH